MLQEIEDYAYNLILPATIATLLGIDTKYFFSQLLNEGSQIAHAFYGGLAKRELKHAECSKTFDSGFTHEELLKTTHDIKDFRAYTIIQLNKYL